LTRVCSPKVNHHLVSGVVAVNLLRSKMRTVWPSLARAKQ